MEPVTQLQAGKTQKYNRLLTGGVLLAMWILLSVASYSLLVVPREKLFDFYPRWEGARAVLAGENPYSLEVSWRIQEEAFGHRQKSGEGDQHFVYLATITWLLLPFWVLPYEVSISLWCGLQLFLLLISPIFASTLLKWKLPPLRFSVLLLFSVLIFRYPINAYLLGQFIPFILACLLVAWWGTANQSSFGILIGLVGMLVRPEVIVIPIGTLLLHNWMEGRKKVVLSYSAIVAFLWLLTRIWIGPWVFDFLNGVNAYTGYSFISWLPKSVGNVYLGIFLVLCVLVWGTLMWRSMRSLPGPERLPWEISVSVLVMLLVFPQPNNYTLIFALIPVWVALWASRGRLIEWIMFMALLASPWFFFIFQNTFPLVLERSVIPLILVVLLTLQWRRKLTQVRRMKYAEISQK